MTYSDSEPDENNVSGTTGCERKRSKKEIFVETYELYWHKLFQIIYRRLHDREIAEEIVQDIFTDLWEKQDIERIQNLENYLSTAAKFAAIDHIRHKTAQKNFLEYHKSFLEINSTDQHILDYNDIPALVQQGMGQLSETTKRIFWLNHFLDWKKETIAEYFQLSEKAIEYHLTKSLKTVKMYLKNISF